MTDYYSHFHYHPPNRKVIVLQLWNNVVLMDFEIFPRRGFFHAHVN